MIPQIAPGRIEGIRIAAGRATWVYDEKGGGYYNFTDEDSFSWHLNTIELANLEIDEQALLDCVVQAEKQFGSPEQYRPKLGLLPNAGYVNIGATFVSKVNPQIIGVFTPTAVQYTNGNPIAMDTAPIDAYFEWYYSPVSMTKEAGDDPVKFMKDFDRLTGNRGSNVVTSPVMKVPTYEEASTFTTGFMSEGIRERFLQQVWNYHHFTSPGFKPKVKDEILEQWKRVLKVRTALSMYEG